MSSSSPRLWSIIALAAGCAAHPTSQQAQSLTCPPPSLFGNGVCTCHDLMNTGELHVLPGPGGSGSVGVNGKTRLTGASEVSGSLVTWGGLSAVGCSVGDSLVTPGDAMFTGAATVGGDAVIGGDLQAVGTIDVGGELEVGGSSLLLGGGTIASRAPYQALGSQPPCECDPSSFFDVAGAVAAARQAASGQSSWNSVGKAEIQLTTGSYYVTSSVVVGQATIDIAGSVSVFVDGSLGSVGSAQWRLAPGAQLDLFVSGNVGSVGQLFAGDPMAPAAFRLYVGGSGVTALLGVGQTEFYGDIYAPLADVQYVGDTRIVGSIFASSILGTGRLEIDYGDSTTPPNSCTPPTSGTGSGSGDATPILL